MSCKSAFQDDLKLTVDLASIIRNCWQTDPDQRIPFSQIVRLLLAQQEVLFSDDQLS